jgi:hypothetical protein
MINSFLDSPTDSVDIRSGIVTGNYFSGTAYLPGAGTPPMKALASILLLGGVFALSSSPAVADAVYDKTCATPGSANHVWYINPGAATGAFGAGDAPNKAPGGTGTADGSQAHPFNSLAASFMAASTRTRLSPAMESRCSRPRHTIITALESSWGFMGSAETTIGTPQLRTRPGSIPATRSCSRPATTAI